MQCMWLITYIFLLETKLCLTFFIKNDFTIKLHHFNDFGN